MTTFVEYEHMPEFRCVREAMVMAMIGSFLEKTSMEELSKFRLRD